MHHTAAFVNTALANVANTDIPALSDQILAIQNGHFLPPNDMKLMAVVAASATLLRARLSSPSLRQITQPQVRPINVGTLPVTDPNAQVFFGVTPTVSGLEELAMQATSGVAMTEVFTGLIWLLDRYVPPVQGQIITLRATSTTAAVANVWSGVAYTLDDQLPNGLYALVGSEVQSANGIAHRWIISNQFFRPGGLSVTALGNRTIAQQYNGAWGEWGRFRNTDLPRLEVLANAADASHTIYPQVVKVG
jgi:hypothetical protein